MSVTLLLAVVICALFCVADAASASSFIKKCRTGDFKCAKESTQIALPIFAKGLPEYNVEPMDPLHYDKLDSSGNDLKLLLTDINITGIKDCRVKKMQLDSPFTKLHAKAVCTLDVSGQCQVGGRLLFLPIEGDGRLHVVLRKIVFTVDVDAIENIGRDGKTHWDLKSWSHSYELQDKAEIQIENLFGGNHVLSSAVSNLLDNSANEVISEVGPPIVKAILTNLIKNIVQFFKKVPAEELTLGE